MKTESSAASQTELPPQFRQFDQQYPAVMRAYEALGTAAQEAGPLDPKTRELVKLGIAIWGSLHIPRKGSIQDFESTRKCLYHF